jgi:hypothetical protein
MAHALDVLRWRSATGLACLTLLDISKSGATPNKGAKPRGHGARFRQFQGASHCQTWWFD